MTLHATRGIVLHTLKYSETSIIARVYTELFGLRSYLVKGVRSPRSKTRAALFQPMSLLDMVVYNKERHALNSIREVRLASPYISVHSDIRKSSVMLFISELAYRAIREEEPNPPMFAFLWENCLALDAAAESVSAFPVTFALALMHHLGIYPQNNHSAQSPVFNLRDGVFQSHVPDHPDYLAPEESMAFSRVLQYSAPHPAASPSPNPSPAGEGSPHPASRSHLLETLLRYYRLHLPGFGEMKSHRILREVLA
jgi:DNA repair protein RecO (recombination protein O)